jgi:membrane-associated phospholipid phosphatase
MVFNYTASQHFWYYTTRLGEAQILLPAALLAAGMLLARRHDRDHGRALAGWWMGLLALAILLTTASKIAFMGWGLGWPALDFTGISGHAMFSAAVYPVLAATLAARSTPLRQRSAIVAGCLLALLIGVSRVVIGVHSVSEVVAGLLLGGAASALPLAWARVPARSISPMIPAGLALWLALMPISAPASPTHSWVTRMSLMLSGRSEPFTRADLHRGLEARGTTRAALARRL